MKKKYSSPAIEAMEVRSTFAICDATTDPQAELHWAPKREKLF